MFTLLTLGTPLGIIVGYIMTSLIITFFGDVPNLVYLILIYSGGMPSMRRPSYSYRWPYASWSHPRNTLYSKTSPVFRMKMIQLAEWARSSFLSSLVRWACNSTIQLIRSEGTRMMNKKATGLMAVWPFIPLKREEGVHSVNKMGRSYTYSNIWCRLWVPN